VTTIHAFKMTQHIRLRQKYLRAVNILFLFLLVLPGLAGIADLSKSGSSVRWVALLLLIVSSKSNQVSTSLVGLSLLFGFSALHTPVSAEEGDWSTEWSSWSRKQVTTRRPSVIVKERLQGESVIFDIKKAAVGVRYRVVVDDYGIRQLIPIDVPVYKEEDFDGVDVSGIDPGLKVDIHIFSSYLRFPSILNQALRSNLLQIQVSC